MENNSEQEQFTYANSRPSSGLSAQSQNVVKPIEAETVQWQASEFIDHQKSSVWFVSLISIALFSSILVFVVTRDILATLVILIAAITFGQYAGKKPRTLTYSLLPSYLKVEQKRYNYNDFKTFSVNQEGALYSIDLIPIKRFMPPLTIYFASDDGEKIFDALVRHIPHEERKIDMVESLMRKIRF